VLVAWAIAAAAGGCGTDDERVSVRARPAPERAPARDRALLAAAYRNDVATARRLVRAGADVNARDGSRQSPYLIATSEVGDDPRLLEVTLAGGARVNDKDRFDGTGLIRAAERGQARIVARLLRAGIDRDHVNRLGWTALLEAIVLGDGGARHTSTVRALVAGGVDVNIPDRDGARPLALAEERGFDEIARSLRAAGGRR
jgi:ankyrin repeat protein